jgi:integrase/recombinase XerD
MITLADWAAFMAASGRSPHTVRVRLSAIRSLCAYRGIEDPCTIRRVDVIGFLGRSQSPWTRLTYWVGINAWASFVREFGEQPEFDPVKGIPKPRTPDGVARPLSDEEVRRLIESPMLHKTRTYVYLGLYQGLRVHEIAKIQAEHFDIAAGWLTVLGKGAVETSIPVHVQVLELAAASLPREGYWFPHKYSQGHVDPQSVSQTISNAMHRAGINATSHQLRDTCATQVQRQQHDIRVTQSMLRHKSVVSTQKYVALDNVALQAAVAGMNWAA